MASSTWALVIENCFGQSNIYYRTDSSQTSSQNMCGAAKKTAVLRHFHCSWRETHVTISNKKSSIYLTNCLRKKSYIIQALGDFYNFSIFIYPKPSSIFVRKQKTLSHLKPRGESSLSLIIHRNMIFLLLVLHLILRKRPNMKRKKGKWDGRESRKWKEDKVATASS